MAHAALAERTEFYRLDAARRLDPKKRSALGQFMTSAPIARFMASLFEDFLGDEITLLDRTHIKPRTQICIRIVRATA